MDTNAGGLKAIKYGVTREHIRELKVVLTDGKLYKFGAKAVKSSGVCAEQGAVSTIYCAVSEEVSGISGKYFDSDCSLTLPSAAARDAGLARKLWEESERLTGLSS